VLVAVLQKFGVTLPMLFIGIGVCTFVVAATIWKTRPSDVSVVPAKAGTQ
jgi:hypothetical protein